MQPRPWPPAPDRDRPTPDPVRIHYEVDRHSDETRHPRDADPEEGCDGERGDDQAEAGCDVQGARMVAWREKGLMKKRPKATVAGVNHDVSHIQNRSDIRTV